MPKKKKTLKQKMQADQRRHGARDISSTVATSHKATPVVEHTESKATTREGSFSLPTTYLKKHRDIQSPRNAHATTIAITTNEYEYLGKDLLKTSLLTLFIVVAELVIRFVFEGR